MVLCTEKNIKYTVKDTVFRNLFSTKMYLLLMYKALHPEDEEIREEDLKIVTLESILLNGIYNDLGFLVRDNRLLILVEAQSTWSVNIIIRSLLYLANTYYEYFVEHNTQLYGPGKAKFPKPELYVIYTGERGNHPDVLSFKDAFFPGGDCCLEVKVKVLYLGDTDNIIDQYIGFCRVVNEQVALHGRTLTAAKEIIRICRDKNLLKDYLAEREKEVEGIMMELFDQNVVMDIERHNLIAHGMEMGHEQGVEYEKCSTARNLLRKGMSIEFIEDVTGLEENVILNIKREMAVIQ